MNSIIYDNLISGGNIGKKNGIKTVNLLHRLGWRDSDVRRLLYEVQTARRNGELIMSDTVNGYYLPACDDEIKHFINSQRSRAINAFKTAKEAKLYLKKCKDNECQTALL